MVFFHGIHKQKEYCLSSVQIFWTQSRIDDGMQIDCTPDMVNVLQEVVRNKCIVLQSTINETSSWMDMKSSEVENRSWWISTMLVSFLVSSSSCNAFQPLVVRPMMTMLEMFLKIVFNSPEFNRAIVFFSYCCMSKKMDQFLRHWNIGYDCFPGLTSVQVLFPIGIVLVEKPASSRLCGFALAIDRCAKSLVSNFNEYSLNWTSEVSCSLMFKFVTNLSDPWEIPTQEWELSLFTDLILIPNPCSPGKQQVEFWCFLESNLLVSMLLRLLAMCTHDKPTNLWIVRTIQCLSSWSTVRFQQHSVILHPYTIYLICLVVITFRFVLHLCNRRCLRARSVFITVHTHEWGLDWPPTTGCPVLSGSFVFFTHFCVCSGRTERVCRNNCAKKSQSFPNRH